MNNNKGFIFLETIIVTVVLTTTLIFLYSNFSKNINDEKKRLYYDDIAYVYKTIFIRNAVKSTINDTIFQRAIDDNKTNNRNSLKNNFVYLFNSESKYCNLYESTDLDNMNCNAENYKSLYFDNTYIKDVNELYKFKTLIYFKTADLTNIKKCINKGSDYFTDNDKNDKNDKKRCENFLNFTNSYSDIKLNDYMLTINGVDSNFGDSIMISVFYERKDGTSLNSDSYKNCLNKKILAGYASFCPTCDKESTDKEKVEAYYNQDEVSYNMACEKAYYISWVYYE